MIFYDCDDKMNGEALGYGLGRPWFEPGCRRDGDFSSLLRVQTGTGVHSASYKMITEVLFLGIMAVKRRTSHPTSS